MSLIVRGVAGLRPDEAIIRPVLPLAHQGQYVHLHHSFQSNGSPYAQDRMKWPIDELGAPRFDWSDALGANFLLNGVLTAFSAVGVGQNVGFPTPWIDCCGQQRTCCRFVDNGSYRYTTAPIDPAVGEDTVVIALVNGLSPHPTVTRYLASTRSSGQDGWTIQVVNATYILRFTAASGANINIGLPNGSGHGWTLLVCMIDNTGWLRFWANGALIAPVAWGGGLAGSARGIGINGNPGGTTDYASLISRVAVWYGVGIAGAGAIANDAAWNARLARVVFGIRESYARAATFTRASVALARPPNAYGVIAAGAPRAGNTYGEIFAPQRENKVYNTHSPIATTGWAATGGMVLSTVDDWAAKIAGGVGGAGPNALQAVNATGAPQVLYNAAPCGNVNAHSLGVNGRISAGAGAVSIGLRDSGTGVFTNLGAVNDGYATRTYIDNTIPPGVANAFAIQIANGVTWRQEWPQLEESVVASLPIPNIATAATATRQQDVLTTAEDPTDLSGRFELTIEPIRWSGAAAGTPGFVYLSGSGNPAIWVEGGTWRARIDGTTNLDSGVAPVAGVAHRIALTWLTGFDQRIEVWDAAGTLLARVTSAYDGTLYSAGTWQIAAQAAIYVRDVMSKRNP